ncbi:ABC transporter ATP-binding protein [Scatolibacter rhodanostii]|uniref:ABC transporter ATP-binding protein n=1 Tax=Scatolibacter rhodanostii TaxID=2014781 RepID=UPI000C0838BD|nr:ABC transporter ATP-binding protein [Scatolibacter rhodanostii]
MSILELKNIYKTYRQGKLEVPVLKDISLNVEEGDYCAIMGPSGSGKTTLMNIIGCLDLPSSGEYYLGGQDVLANNDAKLSDLRLNSIGFVFQSFHLLSRQSALENVVLPLLYAGVSKKERLEIGRKALERVGLGDRTNFKPTQLSGGQCQRVAIARAMVNSPKILLADEPTGALDTASGDQIMEIFHQLNEEGVTIIMITHEQEIADHAHKTFHIRDGQFLVPAADNLANEDISTATNDAITENVYSYSYVEHEFDSAGDFIPKESEAVNNESE